MKRIFAAGILLLALLVATRPARAQDETLTLGLSRDFGYAGFSSDIEGLFSLSAQGPANLTRVNFYFNDEIVFSDDEAPFRFQFTTKDYSPGEYRLYAIGVTSDGTELRSNEFVRVFLSADEARGKTIGLVIPILLIVGVVSLASIGLPLLFGRGKPQLGKYGISGGAVCPKCGLPFPIHMLSFHAGFNNLERCPHCGKWVWVRKAKKEDLAAAEARWSGAGPSSAPVQSKEEQVRRQIDESRYDK